MCTTGYFLILCLFYLLGCKSSSLLHNFRYNNLLRLLVELYLELLVGSIISFNEVFFTQILNLAFSTVNLIGTILFLFQSVAPFLLLYKLVHLRKNFDNLTENQKNRFSSMFCEFNISETHLTINYYSGFMLRRLIFVVVTFFYCENGLFQVALSLLLVSTNLLQLKKSIKYKKNQNQRVSFLAEYLYGLLLMVILAINSENSHKILNELDILSSVIVGVMLFFLYLNVLASLIGKLYLKYRISHRV